MIKEFSKRKQDIDLATAHLDQLDAKTKAKFTLTRRQAKKDVSRSDIENNWLERASNFEFIKDTKSLVERLSDLFKSYFNFSSNDNKPKEDLAGK